MSPFRLLHGIQKQLHSGYGGKNRKDKDKKPFHNGMMPDGSVHIMNYFDENGIKRPKGIRRVLEKQDL
ncbi:14741_t:CDS:2 [Dentiscutata erythropus]|uniref:14741_t:CDS:1 n=1 Tax=Dentiscutata erythropus TaxID=1348616 RepID=A0A9N9ASS1_9GLOM|nr:14741_t:CDS:2 [Dentiscutata erythropus]